MARALGEAFALVINPRYGDLLYAEVNGNYVSTYTLDNEMSGQGYFGSEDDPATQFSGFPRVHTPHGVSTKGGGYGTCLYTSVCTAAMMESEGELTIRYLGASAPGVSSKEGTRSEYAEEWWSRAKRVYGLAYGREGCSENYFNDEYELSDSEAEPILESQLEAQRVSIEGSAWLKARGDYEQCSDVDVYPYQNAVKRSLVVGWFPPVSIAGTEAGTIAAVDAETVNVESPESILAANVGRMRKDLGDLADEAFAWLVQLARVAKISEVQIRDMQLRYTGEVDLDPVSYQKHADRLGWTLRDVPGAPPKNNPKAKRGASTRRPAGKTVRPKLYVPKRLPPIVPKFYGRVKSNPKTDVEKSLERLAKRRMDLGWAVWQADDEAP